ncbi:MAG: SMP-30/gluconolactonase/LRE family protein [Longimicrobiaceae bacterium]
MSDAEHEVRNVLEARARLGEGPVWDEMTQTLFWVDIYNHRVHQFFPERESSRSFDVGEVVGSLAVIDPQTLLLALRHQLARLDLATGEVERLITVEEGKPRNRLNDGKCDSRGRFWIGSMSREEGEAALYRYDPGGSLHVMETGLTISNGLGWSPDGKTFYLTDSPEKTIYAYDFDAATGEISGRRVLVDLSGESSVPDGLSVDGEGHIWSAQWDGWCVIRFAPDGREVLRVPMPVKRPTSCAFGGTERTQLYVTSASIDMSEEQIEENVSAGDLFCLEARVAGLAFHHFGG